VFYLNIAESLIPKGISEILFQLNDFKKVYYKILFIHFSLISNSTLCF